MRDSQKIFDDVMPELISLDRKLTPSGTKMGKNAVEQTYKSKTEEIKNPASQMQNSSIRQISLRAGMAEHPSMPHRVDENVKHRTGRARMSNQISKNLISEMINKISLKSISEQTYPVSNETVERLMMDLDEQIKNLNQEKIKSQNSLLVNSGNQHQKKELQSLQKNLNQIYTIKDLYNEKIENRNKISELQSKIMELKNENRELKIKIARGIQKIQSHIHNLPCERQKELIQQVNKYKQSLNRERDMRQTLEENIHNVNLNFKRFYEQADVARKIVRDQLTMITKKELEINSRQQKLKQRKQSLGLDESKLKGSNFENSDFALKRDMNRADESQNLGDIINQMSQYDKSGKQQLGYDAKRTPNQKQERGDEFKRPRAYTNQSSDEGGRNIRDRTALKGNLATNAQKSIPIANLDNQGVGQTNRAKFTFNMEEQIEKMRMNQLQFSKIVKKKA